MNRFKRHKILCKLKENNVNPVIELIYQSPFELLVAVLLSAQANDIQVNKVTKNLFKLANTPESMLRLGVDSLKTHIKSIGLFNVKSIHLIKICRILIERYNSIVPGNRIDLESLPGVGRKTANIILNVIFGYPTIAVDTHVFRVCNRSRFATGATVWSVEKKLLSVVPKRFKYYCHQWLVLHGRYVCQAKRPKCCICIISNLCEFSKKTVISENI